MPFEALMCGRPVVVADDSGCAEILVKAGSGLIVPVGDVDALTKAILTALADGPLVTDLVKQGRGYVTDHLDWRVVVESFVDLYSQAVGPFSLQATRSV